MDIITTATNHAGQRVTIADVLPKVARRERLPLLEQDLLRLWWKSNPNAEKELEKEERRQGLHWRDGKWQAT